MPNTHTGIIPSFYKNSLMYDCTNTYLTLNLFAVIHHLLSKKLTDLLLFDSFLAKFYPWICTFLLNTLPTHSE